MGESAELTQIQHDDQSHIVSFPKLDKRETAPAASHWHRVGAKPKQHTKVNQQAHSTPLKLTLPLKNRFLPLQESTNAPAAHAPLSPEMRPDGQCGQRRKNQSPRRRAVHVSATVQQQGPISEKADEPDTLIIGDSTIKDITGKKIKTCIFPYGMATIRAQVEKPDAINTVPSPIADAGLARNGHPPPTLPLSDTADSPQTLPWSDAQATIRAQVEKTRISRISKALKSTLPLKNRFLPLQESRNAPATHVPDVHSFCGDPQPHLPNVHSFCGDPQPHLSHSYLSSPNVSSLCGDPQPHLSHSYLSSPNVSSLCDFPAEYKRLEYVGRSGS
ncbi:unnamed protein product [Boreogadus saida]